MFNLPDNNRTPYQMYVVIKQYQETEPEDMSPEEEQFVVPNQVQLEWLMPTWSINMTS